MNSPPPPSFTLPPLKSNGQYPVTPDDSPNADESAEGAKDYVSAKAKGKGKSTAPSGWADDVQPEARISMYVRLFEEMITTVLASEEYLFTPREVWVLRHIVQMPYEPKYLLTRLLLRRPGRILPFPNLLRSYEAEIGPEGIRTSLRLLSEPLVIPPEIISQEISEPLHPDADQAGPSRSRPTSPDQARTPLKRNPYPTPQSLRKRKHSATSTSAATRARDKPWAHLDTGLSAAEEKQDPDLAEAIRESLWASQVGRLEVDDEGAVVPSPPPTEVGLRPSASRSVSGSSSRSTASSASSSSSALPAGYDEAFSLDPKLPPPITRFARDERDLDLDEIMSCIPADELRRIAKARKIPPNLLTRREDVCNALRSLARRQTVLGFAPVKPAASTTARQAALPFAPALQSPTKTKAASIDASGISLDGSGRQVTNSESLLIAQLLPLIGAHAIQLTSSLHNLISRVNLIFSRTPPITASSSSLLLPSILVSSHRRRYPSYGPPTRSRIWRTREDLLRWERAVHWEAVVQDALGESWQEMRKASAGGPVPLGQAGAQRGQLGRVEGSKVVKRIWEGVWQVWLDLVSGDGGRAVDVRQDEGGLVGDRFKTGHVLTRIVYKSAVALGQLHEYDAEVMVLRALLKQRRWRRSKRGAWYDRLALVLMNHYNASEVEKEEKRREAVQVCIDGLLDGDTHLIYRPGLSRRLTRLENKLNLPSDERHISHAELLKCETRELTAPRIAENMGQPKMRPGSGFREGSLAGGAMEDEEEGLVRPTGVDRGWQQTGKSVWLGREGEVTVEGWVLEWWEAKGYKGYHSEGSIMTTLFALLLWPVLFHPLPGAFETPYQTAPLDLGEDTFAPARQSLLEAALARMSLSTSSALDMLRETDSRERPNLTWAVGVNWEYGASDLEELLQCIGGRAMAGVCRMLAEEYRHRVSGVPDLIVWKPAAAKGERGEARFVEVKGPGDQLSETQKIWIDVLLSSGIPVEVCRVKAKEATQEAIVKAEKKRRATSASATAPAGDKNGWKNVRVKPELDVSSPGPHRGVEEKADGEDEEDEGEGDKDEEEVVREGYWERSGKRRWARVAGAR